MTPDELSPFRRNLLRVPYAVMAAGIVATFWPDVFQHSSSFAASQGVRTSLLAGLGAMALLGVRYPLRMLPVLLFEFVWKAIYLAGFALPIWLRHTNLPDGMAADVFSVSLVGIFIPFVPWRIVFSRFVLAAGEEWRRKSAKTRNIPAG